MTRRRTLLLSGIAVTVIAVAGIVWFLVWLFYFSSLNNPVNDPHHVFHYTGPAHNSAPAPQHS